jgi:predicted ArsR family transcriptional regulator
MADVEKKMKEVVEGVVLTLSEAEANAVAKALGSTAGSAYEIERVWTALSDAGYAGEGFTVSKHGNFRVDTVNHW